MKNLAVIYDDFHLKHAPPVVHAEKPERLTFTLNFLKEKNIFKNVELIKPTEAKKEDILRVHKEEYFNFVVEFVNSGKFFLDPDTYIVKDSFNSAMLSAGAAINAVDFVMNKTYKNIFSLMRPPGHHAETDKAMGFCIFNNIAAAAAYALEKYNLTRVAIIDWDVHHGNGTQEIFYDTSKVLFISLHQHPLYPGTGSENEKGTGNGEGYTINFPLPPGTKGETYKKIFKEKIIPSFEDYKPELIFISAGFDAHKDDPLANLKLTEEDFADLTKIINEFADKENLSIISLLEGGYNLPALANSVYYHLKNL